MNWCDIFLLFEYNLCANSLCKVFLWCFDCSSFFQGHYMGIREVNARIITKTLYSFTGILVHGFTDALGLLVPQAHGADNPLMVGRYLQLVIVIYNIMQIPAAIIWGFWTYDAIIWFGYDEETAEIGQYYGAFLTRVCVCVCVLSFHNRSCQYKKMRYLIPYNFFFRQLIPR